jgi:hypothetical protein
VSFKSGERKFIEIDDITAERRFNFALAATGRGDSIGDGEFSKTERD